MFNRKTWRNTNECNDMFYATDVYFDAVENKTCQCQNTTIETKEINIK